MSIITINVVDQALTITNAPMISAGDIKTNYVKFTFDSVWNGYGKTAVFYRDDNPENIKLVALDVNNEAVVPHEITQENGKIWLGVVGAKSNGQVITSEVIWYEIIDGVYTGAMASRSAEASIYARILEVFESMKAAIGSPLTASTAAAMTDQTKIYVYTGSEEDYINGNWYYYNGSEWVSGGVYNSTAFETDKTLSVEDMAADAKVTGDGIGAIVENLKDVKEINLNNYGDYKAYILLTDNKWRVKADSASKLISVPNNAVRLKITANSENVASYAFLTTTNHVNGTVPDFCTGTTRYTIASGNTEIRYIPKSCAYIYILMTDGAIDYEPIEVICDIVTNGENKFVEYDKEQNLNNSEQATARNNINAANKADLELVENAIFEVENVNFNNCMVYDVIIGVTEQRWSKSTSETKRESYIIPVDDSITKITIEAKETIQTSYALLKTNNHVNGTVPDFCTGTSRTIIESGNTEVIDKPNDCKYLWVIKTYGENNFEPASVTFFPKLKVNDSITIPLGLHTMPESVGALNVVKRCRQLTDIKWIPAKNLDRLMGLTRGYPIPAGSQLEEFKGTFAAGTEYTGIPYGRADDIGELGYDNGWVGIDIDFETFITSVTNDKSKLCVESGGSSYRESTIYAVVCSALVCYAINVPYKDTSNILNISGLDFISKINNNGLLISQSSFKIGDILNKSHYHAAVITDIVKNADDNVTFIEISEATIIGIANKNDNDGKYGGVCRRKGWTLDEIYTTWGDYSLYRYADIASVPYTPSPYVNVGDELDMQPIEKLPCMPYEGNNFKYKSGFIPNNRIKILISTGGYNYLKVFKDDVEIATSPFAIDGSMDYVEILENSVGNYKAYLCNLDEGTITSVSYPCKWTIV